MSRRSRLSHEVRERALRLVWQEGSTERPSTLTAVQ